jgi:hypothetical protein
MCQKNLAPALLLLMISAGGGVRGFGVVGQIGAMAVRYCGTGP